jgi:hypothetical protein
MKTLLRIMLLVPLLMAILPLSAQAAPDTVIYVLDVSYYSSGASGCGGDANGDWVSDTVLDCQVDAFVRKNAPGVAGQAGVVAYAGWGDDVRQAAVIGDVSPEYGQQDLASPTADLDFDGVPDVKTVVQSARYSQGRLEQFPVDYFPVEVGSSVNYGAGIAAALDLAGRGSGTKEIYFLATANSNWGALPAPAGSDAIIHAYAVGASDTFNCATNPNGNGSLDQVVALGAPGSSCTGVSFSGLADAVGGITPPPPVNHAPVCTGVAPNPTGFTTLTGAMKDVTLSGATDEDGDALTYAVTAIMQDEPVGPAADGALGSGATFQVRDEAAKGKSKGRVYEVSFTVTDPKGAGCTGKVTVAVPNNPKKPAVNNGAIYNSLVPTP